jgi:heparosan-N-sulfate-glucuronate 5-epimerase
VNGGATPQLRHPGETGRLSRASAFAPPLGRHVEPDGVRGYYLDLSVKAPEAQWPPPWLRPDAPVMHVTVAQFGLGAFERYLAGNGEGYLVAARGAGAWLAERQIRGGPLDGGLPHEFEMPHTYNLSPGWLSSMAQGQAASLLVRLQLETGDAELGEAASRALSPLSVPVAQGGVLATLGDGPFFEEYPTTPSSLVLNGEIFTVWGVRDVALGLKDPDTGEQLRTATETLSANLDRWDTGYWSRYDLFPHPISNVASGSYHHLHITQLRAMSQISPQAEFGRVADRFSAYSEKRTNEVRATAAKVAFRLMVPRNRLLARRLPWLRHVRGSS